MDNQNHNDKNEDIVYMFINAVLGLKFLKNSYSTYATIQHTLDYYIIILMQKNSTIMSRMGINSIDIDTLELFTKTVPTCWAINILIYYKKLGNPSKSIEKKYIK